MPSFSVRETLCYPGSDIFNLVADIERYPEFVPGWKEARVLSEDKDRRSVEQVVEAHGFVWRFRTEAVLERPHRIDIEGGGGPVRRLHQVWRFNLKRAVDRFEVYATACAC